MKQKKRMACMALAAAFALGSVPAYGAGFQTATIREETDGRETVDFAVEMCTEYDDLQNVGDGYFIVQEYKYLPGTRITPTACYSVLDAKTGKTTMSYGKGHFIRELGEGYLLVRTTGENQRMDTVKRPDGTFVMTKDVGYARQVSDGMLQVSGDRYISLEEDGQEISGRYADTQEFSEGLAAVRLEELRKEANGDKKKYERWVYIDKQGQTVIETDYMDVDPFADGMAKVKTKAGIGYIDQTGREVIPCQYKWGGYFRNGVTYVQDEAARVWLIDRQGHRLKHLTTTDGRYPGYADDSEKWVEYRYNGILQVSETVKLPDGTQKQAYTYYDETGQLSEETYLRKRWLSEGLAPYQDKETMKYGYVDEAGNWVIAPVFDRAEPFEDGYAVVQREIILANGRKDVEWGIIRHPEMEQAKEGF